MAYLTPAEYTTKAIDAGASKVLMSTRDTLIRAAMAGATLALAAAFAVTITAQTGEPLAGAVLFPVGFVLLYLLGFEHGRHAHAVDPRHALQLDGLRRRDRGDDVDLGVVGNLVGGLAFVGLTLYSTHIRTGPKRPVVEPVRPERVTRERVAA